MADTYQQDLILTVLPFGQVVRITEAGQQAYLNFSVIVSPRLSRSSTDPTDLSHYPDWATDVNGGGRTWPETVTALAAAGFGLSLPGLPSAATYPAVLIGQTPPDAARFAAMLPGSTPVTPYVFQGLDSRKIRSAPVAAAVETIADLYGRFGLASPSEYPAYEDLVPVDAFGPLGFQQDFEERSVGGATDPGIHGNGSDRKAVLAQALEDALSSADAIPYDLSGIAASLNPSIPGAVRSLIFLEHLRFLQRGLPVSAPPTTPPAPPPLDFHQRIAAIGSLPTLLRVLGIVLDLQAGPVSAADLAAWRNGASSTAQLVIDHSVFLQTTNAVLPAVQSLFATDVFRPAPLDPAATDHANRLLKLGDPSLFRVTLVDHDNAAIKTMQFANSVTRSRKQGRPLTLTTPGRFALPALRSGGFSISRLGRAVQMDGALDRQTTLQNTYFNPFVGAPPLTEDDLIRGYRFDVLHEQDGVWRSLMWRQGTITVDGTDPLDVAEEDTVVPAPTTASRDASDSGDLYLQETLTRWDGWSLAVPRVGTPFQDSGPSSSASGSSGFNVTTAWQVPGSVRTSDPEAPADNARRLPRLRFGGVYRMRARAVDLAGNAIPVENAPTSGINVSPAFKHVRYEPVAAPRVLIADPPVSQNPPVPLGSVLPGASEEVVVVRSENATSFGTSQLDNATSVRLVVPAPTSVFMAEQHGAFDRSGGGRPMNDSAVKYQDIAARDAVDPTTLGTLADPSQPHGTANPYLYPSFLPISYLPDVLGQTALVRGLPGSGSETSAEIPFDTVGNGWPALQAVRIVLSRGVPGWTTQQVTDPSDSTAVTTELDISLGKGDMITTLVNCLIDQQAASVMGVWTWIQRWAQAAGKDPAAAWQAILAGEHWMVTPWRRVTFVHAVRTPLLAPKLYLIPAKTDIGQTYAQFDGVKNAATGTVVMSRKSTARIDLDGTWLQPVDTGGNLDPVTPQVFTGHAFSLEIDRIGKGRFPGTTGIGPVIVNAQNFVERHEFGDTKFRAVTYRATATSFYVEYFRESFALDVKGDPIGDLKAKAIEPGVAFEASTVELTLTWTENGEARSRRLIPAPPGTLAKVPAPTPGDYVVVEDPNLATDPVGAIHGTVQVLKFATVPIGLTDAAVQFSYVGPTIHTYSDPVADATADMHVLNSARPATPHVRYVIPIYSRSVSDGKVIRRGGALRVYLDRPWWSSGDGERLGVVCWHAVAGVGTLPPDSLLPYVTVWGYDPAFASTTILPAQPTPACFPLVTAVDTSGTLSIEETSDKVDVAGHSVGFDADRNLWYCDIRVSGPDGKELHSYTPFIRLALARFQPFSMPDTHLSKITTVDYAQLAPNRSVTVTGSGTSRTVTVAGRAPTGTAYAPNKTSRMIVVVEQRDDRITDDALAWAPASIGTPGFHNPVQLTASLSGDYVTWTGTVQLPPGNSLPLRLTFEEFERLAGGSPNGRLVFTESIPLT